MDTYQLHIPAWYNAEPERNVDECEETVFLPFPPFKGMQIDVADGGIVEVVCVRVAVQWRTSEYGTHPLAQYPRVHLFTNWVQRPEGAPVFRSRSVR